MCVGGGGGGGADTTRQMVVYIGAEWICLHKEKVAIACQRSREQVKNFLDFSEYFKLFY